MIRAYSWEAMRLAAIGITVALLFANTQVWRAVLVSLL
jgi:hypothetical protein